MVVTAEERARLDPYSRIAERKDVTLLQKLTGCHLTVFCAPVIHHLLPSDLQQVVKAAKTGMLVTRDSNGNLHSRAMAPANGALESFLHPLSYFTFPPSVWRSSAESHLHCQHCFLQVRRDRE